MHEAILDRARDLLGDLDGARGDRVRLIHAAGNATLMSGRLPEDALTVLSTMQGPTDEPLDLAAALGEVARVAEEQAGGTGHSSLEVRLLTDLQRRSFLPEYATPEAEDPAPPAEGTQAPNAPGAIAASPILRALDRLRELDVTVVVEDLGPAALTPPNLGIEALRPLDDVLGLGRSVDVEVRIRNFGSTGASGVRVALEVDGERQPSQKVDVPARGTAQAVFPLTLHEGGTHALLARLEGDRLAVDDTRGLVLDVPPPLHVLLVNGDPRDEIDLDEVGYLRAILDPPGDGGAGGIGGGRMPSFFACRTITAAALAGAETDIEEADVIVLANVSGMTGRTVERIEARVAAGGALLVTLGDRTADPSSVASINTRLWRADGTGLLPARLGKTVEVADRRTSYFRVAEFVEDHPALAFFSDERWRPYLTEAPIFAFVACEPEATARVLARLDDEAASPLLIERDYDRGRVFLWTTSIDKAWTRIPESPTSLVPLVHDLLRYSVTGAEVVRNVGVGGTLTAEVPAFPRGPVVLRPDGSRRPLDGEATAVIEGIWRLPPLPDLERAGLWRIEMEGTRGFDFAVQLDAAEGDLQRLDGRSLQALHPALRYFEIDAEGTVDDAGDAPDQGELWRLCAGAALAVLILETLWAAWIGRGRRLV